MNSNFIIMGLPSSGKTTFLAALWHLIESEETSCRLILDSYSGNLTYLNRISEAWRSFQAVPRTSQVGNTDVTIKLRNRETNVSGAAYFPDLAGENFDLQVEERRCKSDFMEGFNDDDGILFFINADVKEDALSITELNSRMPPEELSDNTNATSEILTDEVGRESEPLLEWEAKFLPEQVKIVQLLSDIIRPPFVSRQRRLAVLISAWDLTHGMNLTPQQWLSANMPIVDQFLRANSAFFEHAIYGVSAQGVSLNNESAIDEIANRAPSRRIQIVSQEGEGHDLTEPLVWLMSVCK